jgi:hypothetical protein
LEGASARLNGFVREHDQMTEMIRRFDEIISEKASKMGLLELEKKMCDTYLRQRDYKHIEEANRE